MTHDTEHEDSYTWIKNVKKIFKKVKWTYVILIMILLFAAYLRSYHIDYSTIGYHNMKEDHYLSLALNMKESGNYLRTTWFDCSAVDPVNQNAFIDPYDACSANWGEHPVAVWTLMLAMSILGWKLWVARLMIILFSVLTIIPIYLIVKKLSNNEYLSLLTSFIYAVLPLGIFFGRNIQMDAPAYFFSLMALYFFMLFVHDNKTKDFIIACVFFVFASWFKPFLLIVLFGLIFIIPWSQYKNYFKNFYKYKIEILTILIALLLFLAWPVWIAKAAMPYSASLGNVGMSSSTIFKQGGQWFDTSLSLFTSQYWINNKPMIFSYLADNYSWPGFWLMVIGFALFALKYKSKISKFMFGYALGILIYLILMANVWNAHAYYQYPFLLFAALCIANVFFQAGAVIKSFLRNETAKKIVQFIPLIALLLLIAPFKDSAERVFNTQFFGQDIAGTYINQHLNESEIFLLERGGQNEMSWTARRFYYAVPDDVDMLKRLENEKNLKYIAMTYSGLSTLQQKGVWTYITENYHIAQIGFVQTQGGPQVYHMILEKGGIFNTSTLENKPARLATTYEMTNMEIPYYVIEI